MKDLILIGGGGHCKACIDVIESTGEYRILGILDKKELIGNKVLSYEIIGTDADIVQFKNCCFLLTVGQIKDSKIRRRIYRQIQETGSNLATIISPRAYVAKSSKIGKGTIVMHDALINADSVIGENCIINTKSLIEHESNVGDFCHISTGAILNGNCIIGEDVFIGSHTTIVHGVKIAAATTVGAGSLIIKSIQKSGVYAGCPAKSI